MPPENRWLVRCSACGQSDSLPGDALLSLLRTHGFFRRGDLPSTELLQEVVRTFLSSGKGLPCEVCGGTAMLSGSQETSDTMADSAWGDAIPCELCHNQIPPERLELFPDSRLCVQCQAKEERGIVPEENEFCKHCGDRLQIRRTTTGFSAFKRYCPTCRKQF